MVPLMLLDWAPAMTVSIRSGTVTTIGGETLRTKTNPAPLVLIAVESYGVRPSNCGAPITALEPLMATA